MPQAFTLQPLLEIMQSRTDEATRHLAQLIAAEQSQKSRLQMLEQYRAEYAEKMCETIAQGITRLVLNNYQEFLARIDAAIEQQRLAVHNSASGTKAGQERWQAQNKQLKAIDTLSQRHDARQRYRDNKEEQKLQDEYAIRQFSTREDTD